MLFTHTFFFLSGLHRSLFSKTAGQVAQHEPGRKHTAIAALPDGHESQQSPAGVVDLSLAALDVAPLLARLKILSPAPV